MNKLSLAKAIIYLTSFVFISYVSANDIESKETQWQVTQLENKASLRGSAISESTMWVTGTNNSIFTSADNGRTWLNKSFDSKEKLDFRDIEVFSANTAIVMSVGTGNSSKLLKTNNGGDSWHLLLQNHDEEGFFDSIDFWDDKTGLLLGDPVDGYYVVNKTTDGGKTWRRIAKNKLPELLDKEAAFAASGNTLIVGEKGKAWITTGGFSASVYASKDWGETWQRQEVPLYKDTQYAGGYGLALNAQQQLFVLGGDFEQRPKAYKNIAIYDDNSWQSVLAGQNGLRTAMTCSDNTCIATGKTGSDMSIDHGNTWRPFNNVNATKGDQGFYTIAQDGAIFLAAGANGKVGVFVKK